MIYLMSYCPLANSKCGRDVAARHGIPPYVDASCRREPDFELDRPFISGLCRPSFIAKLAEGEVLVYVTTKRPIHREGRRLVAVLQLNQPFASHAAAAAWYLENDMRIPYSCIVPGNDPLPISKANPKCYRTCSKFTSSEDWDVSKYVQRAKDCVRCFSSTSLFLCLRTPPILNDEFWNQHDCDPRKTQNAGLPLQQGVYDALLEHAGIPPL